MTKLLSLWMEVKVAIIKCIKGIQPIKLFSKSSFTKQHLKSFKALDSLGENGIKGKLDGTSKSDVINKLKNKS